MSLHLDFFHDVVCCWCYNISSRLRQLSSELDLEIHHRTFVLQASTEEMAARWGNPADACETILTHWVACREVSDAPDGLNTNAMRRADFDYPHGWSAALTCKAAERLGGQSSHWDMFDAIQRAHLTEARNIADPDVLADIADSLGLDVAAFGDAMADPLVAQLVDMDRHASRQLQIRTIPAVIVRETGLRLINGPLEDLRAQLRSAARLAA